jgi:hypothetical protein
VKKILIILLFLTSCNQVQNNRNNYKNFDLQTNNNKILKQYNLSQKFPPVSIIYNNGDFPDVECTNPSAMNINGNMVITPSTCNDRAAKTPYIYADLVKRSGVFTDVILDRPNLQLEYPLKLFINSGIKSEGEESAKNVAGALFKGMLIGATLGLIPVSNENIIYADFVFVENEKVLRKIHVEEKVNHTISIYNLDNTYIQDDAARLINKFNQNLLEKISSTN